jgi:DHA2 family multidrug resistance protein-like MFS transporter
VVLATLVLVASVANLPLSVAFVALPGIGAHFDSSQTALNLVAVGYSLGLAASVLWLGALGDRYGRKTVMLLGLGLSVPASLAAAWAGSIEVLVVARVVGGLAAGMAFPTTLALITALWSPGPGRTRPIALWSATGGAVTALGPLLGGLLILHFWWGAAFLVTLPLVAVAVPLVLWCIPAHVNEDVDPVDNVGGVLSVVLVGGLVFAINLAVVPGMAGVALVAVGIAVLATVGFVLRQRHAPNPLYDLAVAARTTFWVAAVAGIIVFGALMGTVFIGQQFVQNVLGYSSVEAGLAIVPMAVFMVGLAPVSARIVEARGARFTLLIGYVPVLLAFLTMLATWDAGVGYWAVGLAYALVGAGVGLVGTPASHSLTGSVPVRRAGMASGTADLQRDLGGAIMQSVLGALLTAGYAQAFARLVATSPAANEVSTEVEGQLVRSFASAAEVADRYPQYADQIVTAARDAFVTGQRWAYLAGIVAVLVGMALVAACFPGPDRERELLAEYRDDDASPQARSG